MSTPAWLTARPIAHRGLHDPKGGLWENTLSAAEAAIAAGYAIECDVQDTADGDAVVFHDHTLERLTAATGAVRDRRAAELTALAVGPTPDRIPTLTAFLDRIAGRVPLVIEIKSRFDGDMRLTQRVCQILGPYAGPVAIKSFDPAVLCELRARAPDQVRGIVAEGHYDHPSWDALSEATKHELANLLHFGRTMPDFVSWNVRDLPSAAPYLCRLLGKRPVMTWTVRTPEDRARAAAHADQIVFEGFRPDEIPV